MSTCPEREALLTADLETLRGEVDTPLAAHLARCPECAAGARRILAQMAGLHALLSEPGTPPPDAARLVRRALDRLPARPPHPRLRWAAAAGLLAAASAAFLLLRPPPTPPPTGPVAQGSAAPPLVESAPGRDVAILETDDPDITILWFF